MYTTNKINISGRYRIGIVTFPIGSRGLIPLSNLVELILTLAEYLCLITGGSGYKFFKEDKRLNTYNVENKRRTDIFTRCLSYVHTQLIISCKMIGLSNNVDLWIFFIGGEGLVLPLLTGKLMKKKVVIASAGSGVKVSRANGDPLWKVLLHLSHISYHMADRIVLYSELLIEEHTLQGYMDKISIAQKHFLDFDKFKVHRNFEDRSDLVGYIGALSKNKGVLNFFDAIPKVLDQKRDLGFKIGGDGELRNKIENCLSKETLNGKVDYLGWIDHDELPRYLNELKLLVLPSYTEGLPNIMLEAMACGTPVLATPVGAIPDIIKDGETGFLMENNSPECIAANVIRALEHPDLEGISQRARALVEREFTYERAVERWRRILDEVHEGKR